MSLRTPLQAFLSLSDTGTTGVNNTTFTIPQDVDSVVFKVNTAGAFTGTTPTCDIYIQTTDDGGTTWFDVVHFKQITSAIVNQNAMFQVVAITGAGAGSRGLTAYIGSVAASTAAASVVTGMPMLSPLGRISVQYGGTIGSNVGINVTGYAPTQSSHQ